MTAADQKVAGQVDDRAVLRFHYPNFDWLRIFAATMVLLSHSFLLAEGTESNEPLNKLTGSISGMYGVCVFFVISGFLITRSAFSSGSLRSYAVARVLRIYPALAVCALLTSFILGIAFTSMDPVEFVADLAPLKYSIKTILHPGTPYDLQSVRFYADDLFLGRTFNGSLWTIPHELACYVIVGVLLATSLLRWPVMAALLLLTLPMLIPWNGMTLPTALADFLLVASSFFAGALIFFFWLKKGRLPAWPLTICGIALALAIATDQVPEYFPLYGAYPLLMLATARRWRLPDLKKLGDISYGMYLYGWPAQQTFVALGGGVGAISWHALFGASTLTAALLGYASWHLIEKRALKWKSSQAGGAVPALGSTQST